MSWKLVSDSQNQQFHQLLKVHTCPFCGGARNLVAYKDVGIRTESGVLA